MARIRNNHVLAITTGLIYLWFGALKFFPELSPAEELAQDTISLLTFGIIPEGLSIYMLAVWEVFLGIGLLINVARKPIIVLALTHMVLTFTPMIFFPDAAFGSCTVCFTLLGQYIAKNIIIIGALVTLYRQT